MSTERCEEEAFLVLGPGCVVWMHDGIRGIQLNCVSSPYRQFAKVQAAGISDVRFKVVEIPLILACGLRLALPRLRGTRFGIAYNRSVMEADSQLPSDLVFPPSSLHTCSVLCPSREMLTVTAMEIKTGLPQWLPC